LPGFCAAVQTRTGLWGSHNADRKQRAHGAQFAHCAPILRVPELIFSPRPDGWQVALNREAQPQIALNDRLWARFRTAA